MNNLLIKKNILLIVTGSIAAVKSLEIIRLLKERDFGVTCILTKGGENFITKLSCASLSGNYAHTDLFSYGNEMEHINLSRANDIILIAPASADILAKMAHGLADDLATATLLASDKQIVVAPAMNVKMWKNASTQRNVCQLKEDGILFIEPVSGALACGEEGLGRMADTKAIVSYVESLFNNRLMIGDTKKIESAPLSGFSALVTSGPTREAIDPVRYISNRSSGKQGHAIAAKLASMGANVTLVSGKTNLPDPKNLTTIHVESAAEMLAECEKSLPVDIAVCAAAVSDWRIQDIAKQKIKKSDADSDLTFSFAKNTDILATLGKNKEIRPKLIVGFAAETENVIENARIKRSKKACDWILANDVSDGKVFDSNKNTVHVITDDFCEIWQELDKTTIAENLCVKIAQHFS